MSCPHVPSQKKKKIPSINEFFYYLKDLILYQIPIFTLKVFIEAYLT